MASIFTEHVRTFGPNSDPTSQVLPALKKLLRYHMKRKNLLNSPPRFLGYLPETAEAWSDDNFEDIVADCYIFAIVKRIESLRHQLQIKSNIDGLISRNVDNFLLERQQKYDPIGYAVYRNVRDASQNAEANGELRIENPNNGKFSNRSILRLGGSSSNTPAKRDQIRTQLNMVTGWSDNVESLTKAIQRGRQWVRDFLQQCLKAGISVLRCGDLIEVLAQRVRSDWSTRHASHSSESVASELANPENDSIQPDQRIEDSDHREWLKRVIPKRIANLDVQARVRDRLMAVFKALVERIDRGEDCPKLTELSDQMKIPRSTLWGDLQTLRKIIAEINPSNSDSQP